MSQMNSLFELEKKETEKKYPWTEHGIRKPIMFTDEELSHLKSLTGKDIGWQIKYATGKEAVARSIYGKVVKS